MALVRPAETGPEPENPDRDRYPNVYDVLAVLQADADLPNAPIERLEVTCLASGEATYRYWLARAEEPEGGYLPGV